MSTLPTIAFFLLQNNTIQNIVVQKTTNYISNYIGAPVHISKVSIDLFTNITFHDFSIQTPKFDTILVSPQLQINLNTFSLSSRFLEIKKVVFRKPRVNFKVDSLGYINFQFIIDKLMPKDTTPSKHPVIVSIREICLEDVDFKIRSFYFVPHDFGMNFGDIHLTNMNLRVTNFRIENGVSLNIRNLEAKDKSGFQVKKLTGLFKMSTKYMVFNNIRIKTDRSSIYAPEIHFTFQHPKKLAPGFFGKSVQIFINIKPSDVSTDDIAYFLPVIKDYHLQLKLSAQTSGLLKELRVRNLNVEYGEKTKLLANADFQGLPDIKHTTMHFTFKSLYTIPNDIESIQLPNSEMKRIVLPDYLKKAEYYSYKGTFNGLFNNFVSLGELETNFGFVQADIIFKPDTSNCYSLRSKISSNHFDLGTFIGNKEMYGSTSFKVNLNSILGSIPNVQLSGTISHFIFNNYNYKNIGIDGIILDKVYSGIASIDDPNIKLDFIGKVNLSNPLPEFFFDTKIEKANLYPLNVNKKDTGAFFSGKIIATLTGNSIDNLTGDVTCRDASIRRYGKQLNIKNVELSNHFMNGANQLVLNSDFIDAHLQGTYQFSQLSNSLLQFSKKFIPSITATIPIVKDTSGNKFTFDVEIKNAIEFTNFFVPNLYISNDTKCSGTYDPANNVFDFKAYSPLLSHQSKKWYNLSLNGTTINNKLYLVSGCDSLMLNKNVRFPNLTIMTDIAHDSIATQIRWNNWDTSSYRGNIKFLTTLRNTDKQKWPVIKSKFSPSVFVLSDTIWTIQSNDIIIDSEETFIDQFSVSHNNQSLKINGTISKSSNDELLMSFERINLGHISTIFSDKKMDVGGIINGSISVSELYKNPIFKIDINIDTLLLNKINIGYITLSAKYKSMDKYINVILSAEKNETKNIDIVGKYEIGAERLSFKINVNQLPLKIIEPYLATLFSDFSGTASGIVTLKGTLQSPELNGLLKANNASLNVNFINTPYHFSGDVPIKNNTFIFENIIVNDSKQNIATLNGDINFKQFKNVYANLFIETTNINCLNTTFHEKTPFFGTAYAKGSIKIKSSPDSVHLSINATSMPNTKISIPVISHTELSELNFIQFKKKSVDKIVIVNKYEKDSIAFVTKKNVANTKFTMDLVIHATPDAIVNIVFDDKNGDEMKGSGSGDLTMTLKNNIFNMDGIFTISDGKYKYTAGRLINREFSIQQGGTVSWSGNPIDAIINVEAIYSLRGVSLSGLKSDNANQDNTKKRIDVDCKLFITDRLMKPNIRYIISLPSADQETQFIVNSSIATDKEMTNQFVMLLMTGNFFNDRSGIGGASSGNIGTSVGIDFLSNQILRMAKQGNNNFDIDFNYRPKRQDDNSQIIEMALSRQLFNDRITIHGNAIIDYESQKTVKQTNNNFVGEGWVEWKPWIDRKLHFKIFNRANQNLTDKAPYTQGIGMFYKKEFNNFGELFEKYFQFSTAKKENDTINIQNQTKLKR